ncbi:MAG: 4Fe-4S dicluster domain-containing protein, partial [Acidobacteriota bacterium]
GAILYTDKTAKEDFKTVKDSCPYDIPRQDPKTKQIVKCDMCIDRVQANLLPMCVKSCAMGAMAFGERADILKQAGERLEAVKKEFPKASLLNKDDVSVIYLVADTPTKYHKFAVADATDTRMTRKSLLAEAVAPLRKIVRSMQG